MSRHALRDRPIQPMDGWENEGGAVTHAPARKPMGGSPIPQNDAANPAGAAPPERIRSRAYEIYQARVQSGRMGNAASDWIQAEREIGGTAPGRDR